MTTLLNTPANDYLERLKKTSGRYNPNQQSHTSSFGIQNPNRMPNQMRFGSPNEFMTEQRSLTDGDAPQLKTSRTNIDGLQERDLLTATGGDIATNIAQQKMEKRRSQQNQMFDSFSGELNFDPENMGDFSGDGSGSGLDGEQLMYAKNIANVGKSRGLGQYEIQIALMTALAESGLRNLNYGDRDSVGLFQQRTSQGWGSINQIMDPTYSANKFYDALGKTAKGANPWNTAQNVQRSFDPTGSNYQKHWGTAQKAYNSIYGGTTYNPQQVNNAGVTNPNLQSWMNAHNNRYLDYDNAFGAQCVDMYSYYTTGFVGGRPLPVGYAPEIYNNYDRSVYTRFDRNQIGRAGDVAIWNPGGGTPMGHVAIVVGDNGNGTLRVLHSNATPQGSRGNSIISNISKSALAGYLRPNKLMGGRR